MPEPILLIEVLPPSNEVSTRANVFDSIDFDMRLADGYRTTDLAD